MVRDVYLVFFDAKNLMVIGKIFSKASTWCSVAMIPSLGSLTFGPWRFAGLQEERKEIVFQSHHLSGASCETSGIYPINTYYQKLYMGFFIILRGPHIPRVPPPFSPMNHPSLKFRAKFRVSPLLERLRHDWHRRSSIHQGSRWVGRCRWR